MIIFQKKNGQKSEAKLFHHKFLKHWNVTYILNVIINQISGLYHAVKEKEVYFMHSIIRSTEHSLSFLLPTYVYVQYYKLLVVTAVCLTCYNSFTTDSISQNSFNDDFADDDWDDLDDTFTADYSSDEDCRSVSSNCSIPVSCIALYNFEVCIL